SDSMTESGYPAVVKLWSRGKELNTAKTLFTVPHKSVSAGAFRLGEGEDAIDFVIDSTSFWTTDYYLLKNNTPQKLNLPNTAEVNGLYQGQLLVSLKADWMFQDQALKQGMVLLIKPDLLLNQEAHAEKGDWQVFLEPNQFTTIESIDTSDNSIIVNSLGDVVAQVDVYQTNNDDPNREWKIAQVEFPPNGAVSVGSVDDESGDF